LAALSTCLRPPQRRRWVPILPLRGTHASSGLPSLRGIRSGMGVALTAGAGYSVDPNLLPLARITVLGHDGAGHRHGGRVYSLPGECAPLHPACRRHPCSGASVLLRPPKLTALGVALTRSLLKRDDVQSRAAGSVHPTVHRHTRSRRSVVYVNQGGST
jgi:hypothetical protein